MDKKSKLLQELEGGYSVQSGVFGALNLNISTTLREDGQYHANIDPNTLSDDELTALASVSAMSNDGRNEDLLASDLFGAAPGVKRAHLVGYYLDIFAGHVEAGEYRDNASSGGLATWILVQLLEQGLIDGVIHAGQGSDENGVLFAYTISRTVEQVRERAKSRYFPMDLSEVLRTAKSDGGRYAITGIPSFITELRLLAEHDPEFDRAIAFTIGLICGHQKSTKYAEAIAWEHGFKPGTLKSIDFRKKVPGKRADEYITEITGIQGGVEVTVQKEASEVFVSSWSHGFFKSKLSDFTDDLFNETADISLGDAWLPEYASDHRGTNLIIVRNTILAELIYAGQRSGELHLEELTPDAARRSQPGLIRHSYDELPYRLARADRRRQWRPVKRVAASDQLPLLRKRIQDVREKIAEQSHIHYRTAVELGDWSYFMKRMKPLVDRHSALYAITDTRRILRKGPGYLFKRLFRGAKRRISRSGGAN